MSEANRNTLTKNDLPEAVRTAVDAALDKQAENLVVLDLRGITSFTEYFVIMNGRSGRQNMALMESVQRALKTAGHRPLSVEGRKSADWVLMDYGDFILHIFSEEARAFYDLEKLWADGPRLRF